MEGQIINNGLLRDLEVFYVPKEDEGPLGMLPARLERCKLIKTEIDSIKVKTKTLHKFADYHPKMSPLYFTVRTSQ